MARYRPGRLYRTLARLGIPTPLVQITGDTFSVDDNQITSITLGHGGTDPSPGIQASTCELLLQRPSWIKTGEALDVDLTASAAQALAVHTGTSAAYLRDRFTGRVGSQRNEDTPGRLVARLKGASWSAQLGRVNQVRDFAAGATVAWAIASLCTPAAIPQITTASYGPWDVISEPILDATYRDTIAKLTSDIGTLARDTRDGTLEIWSLPYRMSWAAQQLETKYPLTRSQAISPATWEQPNEDLPAKVRADWIAADGTVRARSAGGTEDSIVDRHDWLHIKAQTDALDMRFESLVAQQWNRVFRLPSVKVDLLYLLASDKTYHRQQAGMLLELNNGDTIGLSGDWSPYIQGIHVVSGIDEKLTKDEWTMTLSLIPYYVAFGDTSPPVPAVIWESARHPWDDETRIWNF